MAEHGTRASYAAGCSCDQCRAANRRYMARRRRNGTGARLELANRRRQHLRMQLAVEWIREHRPDVWTEILDTAAAKVAADMPDLGPPPTRVCDQCGAVFAPKRMDSLRCSKQCIKQASDRKRRAS